MQKLLKKYSHFVSYHPYTVLGIVVLALVVAAVLSSKVGTASMDNQDTLPDNLDVIEAFEKIEDNFGGSDSVMIALEIYPSTARSNEIRDIRDSRAVRYSYILSAMVEQTDGVQSAVSMGTLLRQMNGGVLPKNERQIKDMIAGNALLSNYVSQDYTMSLVRISLYNEYDAKELVSELQKIIRNLDKPAGLDVKVAGDIAADPIVEAAIGPDMQKTSNFSLIGILVVLFLLFFSVRYALTPLSVIVVGIVWAFGFLGAIGTNMSPATSGAISMIMGVGIDFGIQTITRFRQELREEKDASRAMETTMASVFMPMATTTIAALIGFRAMMMGQLTIMQELATIMSYGIFFCFLAAITVVPVVSVMGERITLRFRKNNTRRKR